MYLYCIIYIYHSILYVSHILYYMMSVFVCACLSFYLSWLSWLDNLILCLDSVPFTLHQPDQMGQARPHPFHCGSSAAQSSSKASAAGSARSSASSFNLPQATSFLSPLYLPCNYNSLSVLNGGFRMFSVSRL